MKRVFIGHRGVGKTQLLQRHISYQPSIPHFDLDQEVEKVTGRTIVEIFSDEGEKKFREYEKEILSQIIEKNSCFVIALGAGFDIENFNFDDIELIFISRITDRLGRIFLNRPRLDKTQGPILEYLNRYRIRENIFLKKADWIYNMPEGISDHSDHPYLQFEKNLFTDKVQLNKAYYTLVSDEIRNIDYFLKTYEKIELRNDLLTDLEIVDLVERFPNHNWLISYRQTNQIFFNFKNIYIDCDIQFLNNEILKTENLILSTHEEQIDLGMIHFEEISRKYNKQFHFKLSPIVETFADLKKGHDWKMLDPENRSFLPRSTSDGKWNWYRQLSIYDQKINFVRSRYGVEDQPRLFELYTLPEQKPKEWAAVLGYPVSHSRSPSQHAEFFKNKNTVLFYISLQENELHSLPWLFDIGLIYMAITSPLKEAIYNFFQSDYFKSSETKIVLSKTVEILKSVNTVFIKKRKQIFLENTDRDGFKDLICLADLNQSNRIVIWGGGGTLEMVKSCLPQAVSFSSQTGEIREPQLSSFNDFDTVIWAAPRKAGTTLPAVDWPVKKIIDLNYLENSMGLEYAWILSQAKKINYISGQTMFESQAKKQQVFWSQQ